MRERESKVDREAWLQIVIHGQLKKGVKKIQKKQSNKKTDAEGKLLKLRPQDFRS